MYLSSCISFLLPLVRTNSKSDPAVYDDPNELQTNPAYGVLSNTKAMKGEGTYETCFQ